MIPARGRRGQTSSRTPVEGLAATLADEGDVEVRWSRRATIFLVGSSGVFAVYGLVGLVLLGVQLLGVGAEPRLGGLPILVFLTAVPGVSVVRFLRARRRYPVPLRVTADGLRIATPYGSLDLAWADVVGVNRRRSFTGQALEVVVSLDWCRRHPRVKARRSTVSPVRAVLVMEAATTPGAWQLVPWLDQEARRRGGGPRVGE